MEEFIARIGKSFLLGSSSTPLEYVILYTCLELAETHATRLLLEEEIDPDMVVTIAKLKYTIAAKLMKSSEDTLEEIQKLVDKTKSQR